jgi:hypothetical protein
MGLLDDVLVDENPLVVTLDFSDYVDGAKLSTLARNYFAVKGPALGVSTMEDYFAELLLLKLKEALKEDAAKNIYESQVKAVEESARLLAVETEQLRLEASKQIQSVIGEIEAVALVPVE